MYNFPEHPLQATLWQNYSVLAYKGFNSMSNLAFEPIVPARLEELVWMVFVTNL